MASEIQLQDQKKENDMLPFFFKTLRKRFTSNGFIAASNDAVISSSKSSKSSIDAKPSVLNAAHNFFVTFILDVSKKSINSALNLFRCTCGFG